MEIDLKEVEFLIGEKVDNSVELLKQRSQDIFSEATINFLAEISEHLFKSPEIGNYPDVATFAFYCRKANLNRIKRNHVTDNGYRIGRGILFHITPGNVPVNFAYSLFAGLVSGNVNIVKVPSKKFKQIDLVINSINAILLKEQFKSVFSKRLYLIRYNRESIATSFFSSLCDVRIIWGGDDSIIDIRKSPIPPKSSEVTFSNRYSISIINAENYLCHLDKSRIALDFYNDTYLFDQNACTSPKTIYWVGPVDVIENAKNEFWKNLQSILNNKNYDLQPIVSIDKLTTFYSQAISFSDIKLITQSSNQIWRVNSKFIHQNLEFFTCSSGFFNEVSITSLDELSKVVNRSFQTIGYLGFNKDELVDWLKRSRLLGVDRIVPLGRSMDFSLFWDGIDLISAFSRRIDVI